MQRPQPPLFMYDAGGPGRARSRARRKAEQPGPDEVSYILVKDRAGEMAEWLKAAVC